MLGGSLVGGADHLGARTRGNQRPRGRKCVLGGKQKPRGTKSNTSNLVYGIWDVEEKINVGFRQARKTRVEEGTSCNEGYSSGQGQNTWANR
jgi:hypothetical protein